MLRVYCSLALALLAALPVQAQSQLIRLTVDSAAAPVPALKYRLLPDLGDMRPGNAALFYQRAHAPEWFGSFRRQPDYDKLADWLDMPADRVPWSRVQALLPANALKEVDLAARCESCDWQITERLRKEGFSMLFPDFQGFREYATLLGLRARLEMGEKQLDKAIYTCQTGLALSRDTAKAPTLINALIGLAIANRMLIQVEELIEQPHAPNLYWALTDLPRPFIDMHRSFQGERLMMDAVLLPRVRAALTNPDAPPLATTELQAINRKLAEFDNDFAPPVTALLSAMVYPRGKAYLLKHGFTAAQVEALPVIQVALMYALTEYDRHFDDMAKWVHLPYWEARAGLRKAEQNLKASRAELTQRGGIPLAELLLPATQKTVLARARLDRRIAALRCVEAVRLYAASHEGRPPVELADIKEVPVPGDPFTGKSFQYRLEGSTAVLSGPAPSGEKASEQNSLRYEITLRQ